MAIVEGRDPAGASTPTLVEALGSVVVIQDRRLVE
jgi:hypothetical protein